MTIRSRSLSPLGSLWQLVPLGGVGTQTTPSPKGVSVPLLGWLLEASCTESNLRSMFSSQQ